MARDHCRMHLDMWDDTNADWLGLTSAQQQVYWAIEGSRSLSTCGVAPLVPARFVKAADMTPAKVGKAIDALAAKRFLLTDKDTVELAVRAHIRRDGVLKMPNMVKSMSRAFQQLLSEPIRASLEVEVMRGLAELYPDGISVAMFEALTGEFGNGYSERFRELITELEPSKGYAEGITGRDRRKGSPEGIDGRAR